MRILIVDDSALVRSILKHLLIQQSEYEVCGEAANGSKAIELNEALKPDLIIMDINMPIMNGLEATRKIMERSSVPILIFSTEVTADRSFEAISSGAIDVMRKPAMGDIDTDEFSEKLFAKIESASRMRNTRLSTTVDSDTNSVSEPPYYNVVVMGASTGGPKAVREILERLPASFSLPIILVQHLETGFDQGYVQWLDESTPLNVKLVKNSELLNPGSVYVAPVDYHVVLEGLSIKLDSGLRVNNQKPAVDVLFNSAANAFQQHTIGVLLTGMGRDGADGCLSIRKAGGHTIVQDEDTCAVFGMPKAAVDLGGASQVLAIDKIAETLVSLSGSGV